MTTKVEIPHSAWLTLVVVSVVVFMVAMETTIIALALPEINASLSGANPAALSWVVNAYSIVVAALLLVSGWLADRYGRRRIFCTGLAVFTVGSVAAGLAANASMLIAARALQAVGGSMQYPAGMALMLTTFPSQRRQMAIGVSGSMGGLAAAVGPALGGFLIEVSSWRAIFLINVPVAVAALALGSRVLARDASGGTSSRVDFVGVPLASFGVAVIILGIVQGEAWGWTSGTTLGSFALGVVMTTAFVLRSLHHPAPLFDLNLLRTRSFVLGNAGSLFFAIGFFAVLVPLPTYIQDVWGWSVLQTGFAYGVGPVVSFLVSPQAGRLADRIGNPPILAAGSVCGVTGMLWLLLTITTEPSIARLLTGTVLIGVAAGTGFAQLVGAALRDVPPGQFAMATAGRTTFFQLSVALSIAVAFALIGEPVGPEATLNAHQSVWILSAIGYFLNVMLFGVIYPRSVRTRDTTHNTDASVN